MQELINEISMGPFGSDIKKSVYTNSGVPVLNGSNLQGFTLKENTFGYVSEEKADSLKKCNAHRGDIIVTHRGTLGQIVYIPNNSLFERYVISQSQFRFNLKPELVRAEFIVYYFHTREGQHKILSNASQVGVPALARATTTFRQLEVKVPPLPVQDKIVGILSALDSKIENNNKINANLEAQAQALFKSWFVDFTPFKDQPFVDSELGPIPQGWKVGKYEDIILDTLAGDWGKEKITGKKTEETPVLTPMVATEEDIEKAKEMDRKIEEMEKKSALMAPIVTSQAEMERLQRFEADSKQIAEMAGKPHEEVAEAILKVTTETPASLEEATEQVRERMELQAEVAAETKEESDTPFVQRWAEAKEMTVQELEQETGWTAEQLEQNIIDSSRIITTELVKAQRLMKILMTNNGRRRKGIPMVRRQQVLRAERNQRRRRSENRKES